MPGFEQHRSFTLILIALAALPMGCTKRLPSVNGPSTPELAGEPQHYSATVVRTVDGGGRTEVKVARSGDLRRSEWIHNGETRISIWRPDLGRVFLLSLERQVYVESELGVSPQDSEALASLHGGIGAGGSRGNSAISPESIDRAFGDESSPERTETEELQEAIVEGHSCRRIRKRAVFPDGHVETTLMFRARDLEGLAIRIESESEGASGRVRMVTEWRDIRSDPSTDKFDIPNGFKKVNAL